MGEDRGDRPLLICGTHALAVEVADLASEIEGYRLVGFVENWERERCREQLEGLPIVWVDDLPKLEGSHWAVCAIGSTLRRGFTGRVQEHGIPFATLVHPTARVSPSARLGAGTIVSAGVMVGAHTEIGEHVFLNRGALVGHHTTIGDHVSVMPGANIAGKCRIGSGSYVGLGALVLDNLSVGADAVVAAGAVVTADVAERAQMMGLPARAVPGASGPR